MSSYNRRGCFKCGGPFGSLFCRQCTCGECRRNYMDEVCSICCVKAGIHSSRNSFVNDPNPNSFNDSPNFFNHPPQPQMYSCELCGNDAHYGYDCPPQVPLVYEPEPCYNQNFDDIFPQNSPNFQQQILCCENCGGPHESYQCQPMNQNYYDPNLCYNFNSSGFDQYQPPQYSVTHQTPMAELLLEEKLSQALQALCEKLNKNVQEKQEEKNVAEEQAAKVSSQYWKPPIFYDDDDDDDEESSIPLRDLISELPLSVAITPDLPITDSLIMEDEHLNTIPETESDEENESSVEDLNLTPSESEDLSDIESECDMPFCDDFIIFF
ncbi:hypothetical protein Tco_1381767 [Tanacetum coccineum]